MTLEQIDRFFHTAEVILFLGIVGIFLGYYIHSDLVMNISLGIELFVGLTFLVPIVTAQVQTQLHIVWSLVQYQFSKIIDKEQES